MWYSLKQNDCFFCFRTDLSTWSHLSIPWSANYPNLSDSLKDTWDSNMILWIQKRKNILSCLWSNVPTLILSLSVGQINGPWQPEHLVVSCDHSKEAKEEKEVKERWDTYLLQGAPCSVSSWTRCSHPLWLPSLPLSTSEEVVVKMQEAQKKYPRGIS